MSLKTKQMERMSLYISMSSMWLLSIAILTTVVDNVASANMTAFKIEKITEPLACGEGPHWEEDRKVLYLVDIPNSLVMKYDPATNTTTQAKVDGNGDVGFILPVKGTLDKFVIGLGRSLAIITWDGVSKTVPKKDIEILHTVEQDKVHNKFNDGKTDPRGRVFGGTMGHQEKGVWDYKAGNLYSIDKSRKLTKQINGVGIANGLAWTRDQKIFYYIDSLEYTVDAFDYNVATGQISNRRVVFDLKKNNIVGIPDGMVIDTDDNLWVALYGGSNVIHINPRNGTLIRKLPIPGRDITSVAFAGKDLTDLIVTSSYQDLTEEERTLIPEAGATFRVTGLGVRGYPGIAADI